MEISSYLEVLHVTCDGFFFANLAKKRKKRPFHVFYKEYRGVWRKMLKNRKKTGHFMIIHKENKGGWRKKTETTERNEDGKA